MSVLEEKKEELIVDLERAQARLRSLEEVEDQIEAREDALERQQHTLEQSLNEEDQGEWHHLVKGSTTNHMAGRCGHRMPPGAGLSHLSHSQPWSAQGAIWCRVSSTNHTASQCGPSGVGFIH